MTFRPLPRPMRRSAIAALLGLGAAVTWAMLQPGLTAPPGVDKVVHLGAFGVLTALGLAAAPSGRRAIWTMVGLLGLAGGSELAQTMVPGRVAGLDDLVANLAGLALGVFAFHVATRMIRAPAPAA